ncbi:hypothetical protein [Nonomuraea zeae]|uniref:hypothetical protein n=1 Tax=Nonomuraea zeae TaxID=1642303 RepID=UPI0014780F72|nr:hypothetical protein [Nonomuraea zeae]
MRTRLPAALLFLLSWLLPVTGHAQLVQPAATAQVATWSAGQPPEARQLPYQPATARVWAGQHGAAGAGGAALLAAGPPRFEHTWAAVVAPAGTHAPGDRRPAATPARAPPSTGF